MMGGLGELLMAMAAFAVLFTVFGLWVRASACDGSCDSCASGTCERKAGQPGEAN